MLMGEDIYFDNKLFSVLVMLHNLESLWTIPPNQKGGCYDNSAIDVSLLWPLF